MHRYVMLSLASRRNPTVTGPDMSAQIAALRSRSHRGALIGSFTPRKCCSGLIHFAGKCSRGSCPVCNTHNSVADRASSSVHRKLLFVLICIGKWMAQLEMVHRCHKDISTCFGGSRFHPEAHASYELAPACFVLRVQPSAFVS